jgi:hypothetical protein
MAHNAAKAKEAIRKEGDRLEADLIRLSKAFWEGERGRLGRLVLHTRSGLVSQQKLVLEKRVEAEKAQRVLVLSQGDLERQKSDLTRLEGQLKASEEAQRKARDNCMVI